MIHSSKQNGNNFAEALSRLQSRKSCNLAKLRRRFCGEISLFIKKNQPVFRNRLVLFILYDIEVNMFSGWQKFYGGKKKRKK